MNLIRSRKSSLSIDLAPLIDVVFQLLVFFMLTMTFANPSIKLSLPQASAQPARDQEFITISIDQSGDLFINGQRTTSTTLVRDIRKKLIEQDIKSVHIKGDQEMPYKYFVEVMDKARKAGAVQVNIVYDAIHE